MIRTVAIPGYLLLLVASTSVHGADDARRLDFFEKRIRPVLVERCYECHSSKTAEPKAGLRLDSRQAIRRGGESGPTVVPGRPDESLLLEALRHESFEMPPDAKLPSAVVADFESWIADGAIDPREEDAETATTDHEAASNSEPHWAFEPVRNPEIPQVADPTWVRDPLDAFVLARLEAEGLTPAPEADAWTLIRRLHFDLVGLPPTPETLERFAPGGRWADEDSYGRLADELLSAPEFGERWGRHWLDVARFAESAGGGRSVLFEEAWRYRDYVIDAFSNDVPFDRFIKEQIAGDLLEAESREERWAQLVATGFLAVGPKNLDDQNKYSLRMDVVDEQLDTIGRAVLGLTIGCARCHDHKFDPFSNRDYYSLAGILRSTKTLTPGNVSGYVTLELPVNEERRRAFEKHLADSKAAREAVDRAKIDAGVADGPRSPGSLAGVVVDDVEAELVGDWKPSSSVKFYVGSGYLHDGAHRKGEMLARFQADLESGEYEVRIAYASGSNRANQVPVTIRSADRETLVHVDQKKQPSLGRLLEPLGRFRFEADIPAEVTVSNAGTRDHVVVDAIQFVPVDEIGKGLRRGSVASLVRLKKAEAELRKIERSAPPPLPRAIGVQDEERIEDSPIHLRGVADRHGAIVPRGFPKAIVVPADRFEMPSDRSGRHELAQWITSPSHPLTGRVWVNRVWSHLFGAGIVPTEDNFGRAGAEPTHPDLLDRLASDFVNDGWSTRRLIRRLILSATYRQSAHASAPSRDPENRLLSSQRPRRLEAEALRDAMLAIAGRLDRSRGGNTKPKGLKSEFLFRFEGDRRSVYLPVFRNASPEIFDLFDFANPNFVVGRRNRSTLPTQGLYFLNSPEVLDWAEGAVDRLSNRESSDESRIRRAWLECLAREPSDGEFAAALAFVSSPSDAEAEHVRRKWTALVASLFGSIDFRHVE